MMPLRKNISLKEIKEDNNFQMKDYLSCMCRKTLVRFLGKRKMETFLIYQTNRLLF